MNEFLTVEEAAKLLRLGRWTLYRLCSSGEFPCVRIGKSIRIRMADLRGGEHAAPAETTSATDAASVPDHKQKWISNAKK